MFSILFSCSMSKQNSVVKKKKVRTVISDTCLTILDQAVHIENFAHHR